MDIGGAFCELRGDKDFFYVTLACGDDQIQAHKVILSVCSPFFLICQIERIVSCKLFFVHNVSSLRRQ